ncbi:PepSY-associated TM helix domain-containing protein [Variovorax sp. LT2P21]|uniref:PepSY-associated TM helix domain-containing protein n=1 Tax=Variovorax sp. LT2P21 TaxID=3443731 RepID=UPI003F466371
MKNSFRASMAWLHTWAGLLTGWLLFAVFVTGTAAYYRSELSLWMRPELHAAAHPGANRGLAAAHAVAFLQRTAPEAESWIVQLPDDRDGLLQVRWSSAQGRTLSPGAARAGGRFEGAVLDPVTGIAAAPARATWGGDFFYVFHFTLHYLPVRLGRWLVSAAAMFMLVALVSGVITHRRIFADFFTFRPRKGQRSWLDAHNAVGVLALPFHLMITYSGLVTLMFLTMPAGLKTLYGEQTGAFFAQVLPQAVRPPPAAGEARPLTDLPALLAKASAHGGGAAPDGFTVLRPNDANARVVVTPSDGGRLSNVRRLQQYDGVSGTLIAEEDGRQAGPAQTRGVLYGLHLARFADGPLRLMFFVCGLAGSAMVATGLLLWSTKRRARPGAVGGLRLVDSLNLATIAGLPAAIAVLFCANRLLPAAMAGRAAWEIDGFFIAWGAVLLLALVRPSRGMWCAQLALAAVGFIGAPLIGMATSAVALGSVPVVAVVDLALLLTGIALAAIAWRLRPIASPR